MGVRAFQKSRAIAWAAGILGVLGIAGLILALLQRVWTDRGLQSYRTGWGFETNAVQVLSTVAFLALVFGAYGVVSAIRRRRS
jgi:hypothetical protein